MVAGAEGSRGAEWLHGHHRLYRYGDVYVNQGEEYRYGYLYMSRITCTCTYITSVYYMNVLVLYTYTGTHTCIICGHIYVHM